MILNPWQESYKPIRLYQRNYTVAGEKEADWYITPWDRNERRNAIEYGNALGQLGMNDQAFIIECVY